MRATYILIAGALDPAGPSERKRPMTHTLSAADDSAAALRERRRLLRLVLSGCLLLPALAVAGCGTRRDLPEERRTRGKFGHRGD
jgi:hypothetical protein